MSLINQMLQDLERRRALAAEHGTIPNSVRALPSEPRRARWALLIGVTALALAGLGAWAWFSLRSVPAKAPAPQEKSQARAREQTPQRAPELPARDLPPPASRMSSELALVPRAPMPRSPDASTAASAAPAPVRNAAPAAAPAAGPTTSPTPPSNATNEESSRTARARTAAAPDASAADTGESPGPAKEARPEQRKAAKSVPARPPAVAETGIDKRLREPSPAELADNEYRQATLLLQQGDNAGAERHLRLALGGLPAHQNARHALFGLLLESRRLAEAEKVLADGLRMNANQPGFAMALARLQVDRGDNAAGINTLQSTLSAAQNNPDYLAFLAALLQRAGRHGDAVENYNAALRMAPQSGVWWMGLGISLQALNRIADARDAFGRAKASHSLNPELQAFVDQRLRQLR